MSTKDAQAPGGPGIPARWTSSAKTGLGTALSDRSLVWFTLSHGIFNEVYFPRIDQACMRDMGLLIASGDEYLCDEKRDTTSVVTWLSEGVPAFRLTNTCKQGRFRIEKEIVTDPERNAVIQKAVFFPLKGTLGDYRIYVLLSPHLGNHGSGNTAWVDHLEGRDYLLAQREGHALALTSSTPMLKRSAGYVGSSDGWQDLKANNRMTQEYTRAENGNVALIAELDVSAAAGTFVLTIGFGSNPQEAARTANDTLTIPFEQTKHSYIAGWTAWQALHAPPKAKKHHCNAVLAQRSKAVLRAHECKTEPGALIASLSIPWGFNKGDDDLGGYHLVWPRDMVETAGALLAIGAKEDAYRALTYLKKTQQSDGHWAQNMWVDGLPYWDGIQMDETAMPILLVDLAYREKALTRDDLAQFWPMVREAAGYIVRTGPVSPEDRWEEDPGYSPFTIAAQIAGLLAAADIAELQQQASIASYLREAADVWNDSIDRWMYAVDDEWDSKYSVDGYYVRIAPVDTDENTSRFQQKVQIKNVIEAEAASIASHLVSPDALALVRFGLRAASDQRMVNTVKVIDALLKVDTPQGPVWHRYNGDGYGEHADGGPFDGIGVGRGWPLLTGERAHYELAAGRIDEAKRLLESLGTLANDAGFLPEQVWDQADLPERELFFGKPTGSAMPLVWAHAEYLKLQRSLHDGAIFDMPPQTVERYLKQNTVSPHAIWRFNNKLRTLSPGKTLRIESLAPTIVRWSTDGWATLQETPSNDTTLGIHVADLTTSGLNEGSEIILTFYWPDADHWEGENFIVQVAETPNAAVTPISSEAVTA